MEKKTNAMEEKTNAWIILILGIPLLFFFIWIGNRDLKPYFKGSVVNAVVSGRLCGFKTQWIYCTYQGQEYSLSVGKQTCRNLPDGEILTIRLLPGVRRAYFPDDNPVIVVIIGIVSMIAAITYAVHKLYTLPRS
jgi:hypothetical protein